MWPDPKSQGGRERDGHIRVLLLLAISSTYLLLLVKFFGSTSPIGSFFPLSHSLPPRMFRTRKGLLHASLLNWVYSGRPHSIGLLFFSASPLGWPFSSANSEPVLTAVHFAMRCRLTLPVYASQF